MESSGDTAEPRVLYKYLPSERAIKVLPEDGNGALRATQPAALNDPFKCATRCSAVYPSDDVEIKEIVEALNWIVPEHSLNNVDVQVFWQRFGTRSLSANLGETRNE